MAPHGHSGMFLARWSGARPRTAWVRGRRARTQQDERCGAARGDARTLWERCTPVMCALQG